MKIFVFLLVLEMILCSPPSIMGGGNFDDGQFNSAAQLKIAALKTVGLGMCRVNLYPASYWNAGTNQPNYNWDDLFLNLQSHGITPMNLFEWYNSFDPVNGPGNYTKWFSIGKGHAQRYGAGGDLAKLHNLGNYGVSIFSAANEPEGTGLSKAFYHQMLEGLADGVHSVNPNFKVNPGGFKNANAFSDFTLDGFGLAIADLWNAGKLDGIDLHTYSDIQYAPIENTYHFSAQYDFDQVKAKCNIVRDVNFYTTEFNYKKRLVTETEAALGILTDIWDNLGVVNNAGKPCNRFALVWNLYNTPQQDDNYGLAQQLSPSWIGTARGKTLQMVAQITSGLEFESADPKGKGEYVLSGNNKKLWVWQNRNAWTNHLGTWYLVTAIPAGVSKLTVYDFNGPIQAITLKGETQQNVTNLATGQTFMFLAE